MYEIYVLDAKYIMYVFNVCYECNVENVEMYVLCSLCM